MNSFFASCAQQDDPKLRKKPIAVVPMMNVNTTAVLAASYEAKKFGIKTGTSVGDAKRLCPGIQFVMPHSDRYVYYHDRIAEVIDTVIPIEHVLSIDEFACQLKGSQCKNEAAVAIAKKIKQKIESEVGECLTTSIGIAENVILAKAASDMQKPNGLVVIDETNREKILSPLSVRILSGIGAQTEKRLNLYGIKTIGELLLRSEAELRQIWGGVIGARFYHWIRGGNVFVPFEKNKSLGHQHVLKPDKRNIKSATTILKTLLLKASVRLRRKGYYTSHLGVHIKWLNSELASFNEDVTFPETQDSLFLMRALDQILNTHLPCEALEQKRLKPLRVGIYFGKLTPKDQHQDSLFEDVKRNQLLMAFDQINEKFGKKAITLASIRDEDSGQEAKIAFTYIPDKEDL